MTGTTREGKDTSAGAVLHVALELDDLRWTLTMGTAVGRRPRQRRVRPRDRPAVLHEIQETKRRFGLPEDVRVVSCYEAGREAFWLHRWLGSEGIENRVVDSASIEVNRRKRRAKADRLDGRKLLRMLIRHESGEKGVWSVVRVPSVEAEDARHLHRELTAVKRDRTRVANRIKGLLAGQGVRLEVRKDLLQRLEEVRLWDGSVLPPGLRARLERAWEQHQQGISKAGTRHVRAIVVQVAWGWLRHQPQSELSLWYNRKFGPGSSRVKKIGIVALSRRLLIELWRYLETGAIPEGATVRA